MMVNWRVVFCEIISVVVCSYVPIYSKLLKHFLVSQPVLFRIPCFEHFGFKPKFTNPSIVEFSVLRGVAGCLWSNAIKYGRMLIAVFLLLNIPHASASYT